MTWTLHHILYPLLGILILAGAFFAFHEYQLRKDKERDVAVEEARQQELQKRVADIEKLRQEDIAVLEAERKQPATVQTVTKYVKIPGGFTVVDGTNGQPAHIEITGDPQTNLNALTQFGIDCAEAKVDRNACQKTAKEYAGQIKSLTSERDSLKDLMIPHWTLTAAVSKAREGGYKPAAMIDYRVGRYWGLSVGAVNNSLVGGVTIHFGGMPKPKDAGKVTVPISIPTN